MTNKLPVVGKRYRVKAHPEFSCEIRWVIDQSVSFGIPNLFYINWPINVFWESFEELPEDKAETKPEADQVLNERYVTGRGMVFLVDKSKKWAIGDTINHKGKNFIVTGIDGEGRHNLGLVVRECETKPETQSHVPEDGKMVLSPEVNEAIEELKNLIDNHNAYLRKQRIEVAAENLLNALEKQFKVDGKKIGCLFGFSPQEKRYTTLTDFINDYEKLKARIKKLEEKCN